MTRIGVQWRRMAAEREAGDRARTHWIFCACHGDAGP